MYNITAVAFFSRQVIDFFEYAFASVANLLLIAGQIQFGEGKSHVHCVVRRLLKVIFMPVTKINPQVSRDRKSSIIIRYVFLQGRPQCVSFQSHVGDWIRVNLKTIIKLFCFREPSSGHLFTQVSRERFIKPGRFNYFFLF